MIAMLVGTVLALAALAYVLYPLLRESDRHNLSEPISSQSDGTGEMTAVDALREIEFDYATGKLSDGDYRALKTSYGRLAAAELSSASSSELVCPACGVRPEPDAKYCSNCGARVAAVGGLID